ncbi:MAG: DUF371 domain-containing protein [Candidatus Thorarchaeota archaeon]
MRTVQFTAYGHVNVVSMHRTTVEITAEEFLTPQGTCIIGVRANQTLQMLDDEIKKLARNPKTRIILKMSTEGITEEVTGRGSEGLTYSDSVSMVARKSNFECSRTLMIDADKAALDLNRRFIEKLKNPKCILDCELIYISG